MGVLRSSCDEVWLPVVDWVGFYEVSNLGRVRSVDRVVTISTGKTRRYRGRLLRATPCGPKRNQYLMVHLSAPERLRKAKKVHHLVLEAFVGPRPPGQEARHLNGENFCNHLDNLKWGTPQENGEDRVRHDTHTPGMRSTSAKLTDAQVLAIRHDEGKTHDELAIEYGVSRSTISQVKEGVTWRHVGGPRKRRPQAKLTEDDVRAIRKDTRMNIEIAPDFGVAPNTISAIKHGHYWKHVK